MRFRLQISLLAAGVLLGDCGRLSETVAAHCDVGDRPGYFVPSGSPPVLIGCARLGVSGKRVEFSTHPDRIDGEPYVCINPTYGPRGRFIPAICTRHPPPSNFRVHDSSQPRQGVRGYAFVIWGTAPAGTDRVVARAGSARARAVLFTVPRSPTGPPFGVFVLELPLSAACEEITVVATRAGAAPTWTSSSPRASCRRAAADWRRRPGGPGRPARATP